MLRGDTRARQQDVHVCGLERAELQRIAAHHDCAKAGSSSVVMLSLSPHPPSRALPSLSQ
jgi:hypothetical protein